MARLLACLSFFLISFCLFTSPTLAEIGQDCPTKPVVGWVENVYLLPWKAELKAKLDTGARTSSLHAENIESFKKGDERWVRFDLHTEDANDEPVELTIERPVERRIRIKDHNEKSDSRPVVTIPIMLGNEIYDTQFSLADRSEFIYPVLLGRRLLKDIVVIDPDETFITELPKRQKDNKD